MNHNFCFYVLFLAGSVTTVSSVNALVLSLFLLAFEQLYTSYAAPESFPLLFEFALNLLCDSLFWCGPTTGNPSVVDTSCFVVSPAQISDLCYKQNNTDTTGR